MGYNHESRFKKKFNLEKNWIMNTNDIAEITSLDPEDLQAIYLNALKETKSRSAAINAVCGFCLKSLFPREKPVEDTNVAD
tara:strand:+ start:425 stop:667 length:243 start_codon:yes stop_codon:yes gene_type:complete